MKSIFIPAKIKARVNKKKIKFLSKKLPKNIAIVYSVQYQEIAKNIKEILLEDHNITDFFQILGCSKPDFSSQTQAVLLITSGRFHAMSLAIESNLPIYILGNKELKQISKEEIISLKKKQKAAYLKFLNADCVGILVSTKPGQENLKKALGLKKSLDKKSYVLIGNEINSLEFENFSIDSWINTACPRLDMDFPIINIRELNISKSKKSF